MFLIKGFIILVLWLNEFKYLFKIGEDDRFITASDADGMAFSALENFLINETDDLQLNSTGFTN